MDDASTTLRRLFTDHPKAVEERYFEHMGHAFRFGWTMISTGIACLVHGLIPGLHVTTGSDTVSRLHARMESRARQARGATEHRCPDYVI